MARCFHVSCLQQIFLGDLQKFFNEKKQRLMFSTIEISFSGCYADFFLDISTVAICSYGPVLKLTSDEFAQCSRVLLQQEDRAKVKGQ